MTLRRNAACRSRSSPTPRPAPRSSRTRPRADFNYYTPAEAQADPLRGRDGRSAARPAALPEPGLALRLRRRPRRLPARLDRAKAWGIRPARARALPGLGRPGLRVAGARLARVPRPESRKWRAHLYRYNANVVRQINANIDTARETKAFEQWNRNWVTFVERNVGAWMHVEHGLGLYLFANANRRAPTNMHNNAISVNSMHRIRSRPGPSAVQPDAVRGDRRASTAPRTSRPGTATRPGRASARPPSSSPRSTTGARRSSPRTWSSSRSSASCSAANLVQQAAPGNGDFVTPTVVGAEEYDYAERDLRYTKRDVPAAYQRQGVRRPQQSRSCSRGWRRGCRGASLRRARCSRCGRSPTPSPCASRTAWTEPRTVS